MHRPSIRQLATVTALALTALVSAAACGSKPVSPLPIQTPSQPSISTPGQTPVASPSASASRANPPPQGQNPPPVPKPTKPITPRPKPSQTSTCMGGGFSQSTRQAVRYDLDLHNTELALVRSMCFRTGGILRLQGIGPGLVTAEPTSLVEQNYEAGVVDITFIRPGTVTVTIPQDEQNYTITVVVNQ